MHIKKLKINNFRNFDSKELVLSEKMNLIIGKNAAGKTSVLEAINLVSSAKSFRAKNLNSLINKNKTFLNVKLILKNNLLEEFLFVREKLTKTEGKNTVYLKEKKIFISEAALKLPVQLINQDDFFILEGSPKVRRKFLDWGVFHVKHNFFEYWKNYNLVLKQRNALLKNKNIDITLLDILDSQLVDLAENLNRLRKNYLDIYLDVLKKRTSEWFFLKKLNIKYFSGWDETKKFSEILLKNRKRDMDLGLTNSGAHRCDLKFEIEGKNLIDFLSRGQQKIFVIILKIAQGDFLNKIKSKKCIYLIDELYSELDKNNFNKIMNILSSLENQVLLTMKDKIDLSFIKTNEISL